VVSLFKDRSPAAIIWLFILSFIVHSHFLIEPPAIIATKDNGLFSVVLTKFASAINPQVTIFLYHAIVLIQALRLNYLFSDNQMFSKANFLTAMVYVLLTGVFSAWGNITPALLANSMIIWFFTETARMYNNPNPKALIFNIGLITGASVLLYHPCTILLLLGIFALLIVRPFFFAEWIVLVMGAIAPFYFLFSYLYLTDRINLLHQFIPQWRFGLPHIQPSVLFFTTIAAVVIVLLTGLFYVKRENRRLLIHARENWTVFQVMLLLMLPLPFISKNSDLDILLLFIVPFSPFIAKGFLAPQKHVVPNTMFWCLVVLTLLNGWNELLKF
jgi:hypothetical protein